MHINHKHHRKPVPPRPDVAALVDKLLTTSTDELAELLGSFRMWLWPRCELMVWYSVLDRFDDILAQMIKDYHSDDLQMTPFTPSDKELIMQILRFERMLLDNSTTRKLFNSYDRLTVFLTSPDPDVAIEALALILRPAHQYTQQINLSKLLNTNHQGLETLARTWPVLREYDLTYADLVAPDVQIKIQPEASDVHFQFYSPKGSQSDPGPYHIHIRSVANDSRRPEEIVKDAIEGKQISPQDRFDLLCQVRAAKALVSDASELRSKLVTLRLLAIAIYCHTHNENTVQSAKLLSDPDLISHITPLLVVDKGISDQIQAAAIQALDGICHHRSRATEVLTAVNASVAHGLLMTLFRKSVARLDETESEPAIPVFEALQTFLEFLSTHEISYNMVISAGLVELLMKVIGNHQPSLLTVVARTVPLLENSLYGPPQSSAALPRNNSPFQSFLNQGGIQFLLDRIQFEIDTDLKEHGQESEATPSTLGYGRIPTPRVNVLKHLIRTVQRMLQSQGSAEVLRQLPDSSFNSSIKRILDHRAVFGSTIVATATLAIATWIHNEPSCLSIIQETKLPESFYNAVEEGIEPTIEVIHGVLNAMGALSLNQAGQNLLQARSNVIDLVFRVFTSDVHIIALQEKSNANLIGGDVDELVRHHPWLKPSIFAAITSTLGQIEEAIKQYTPKAGMEGYFRLLLGKSPEPEAGVSSGDAKMETDQLATTSSEAALPNSGAQTPQTSSNGDSSYHITEIPPYQYLNCFSKFLIGFFSHAQHGRELLADTDILERLDRLLTVPQWPIGFPLGRNLDNVLVVSRRLMDSNPTVVLKHYITKIKSSLETNKSLREAKGPEVRLNPYVWLHDKDEVEANALFANMRALHMRLTFLHDCYSQGSSHSLHQPYRRETVNMLEPLVEHAELISQLGEAFSGVSWEMLHLRFPPADGSDPSLETQASEQLDIPPWPISSPPVSIRDLDEGDMNAETQRVSRRSPPLPPAPTQRNAFASAMDAVLNGGKPEKPHTMLPQMQNYLSARSLLHATSTSLISLFSSFAKWLPTPRRLPVPDSNKYKKDSKIVTEFLADNLIAMLRRYSLACDNIATMDYSTLVLSCLTCFGPDPRHGQNLQTALFLEFHKKGGIEVMIEVCQYAVNVFSTFEQYPLDTRLPHQKNVKAATQELLHNPLIWFYHILNGKALVDSPQTADIVRNKTIPGFEPSQTLVQLRLETLPLLKQCWESKWLTEATGSIRRAVVYGLLAIMKGEYEDPTKLPTYAYELNNAIPPIFGRPRPVISQQSVQQLMDMGFPERAVRGALSRAHGDVNVATEYLLTNAHLFEDLGPEPGGDGVGNNEAAEGEEGAEQPSGTEDDEAMETGGGGETVDSSAETGSAIAPRDYAKELATAREELQASLVKHALRLADFNYEFVEDVRAVFVGDHAKVYSRQLFEDVKKFSPAAYDIYEAPLKVRCRLLAGVLLKVGLKGVDFSEAETTELLDGLLALLLSGPAPGTPEQPVIPKWLSNHLMVTDRVLCSGEDIKAVAIPKQDEEITSTELYVGPSYKESREILFQFCMRLLRIPNLAKEDLLSLIGVLVFLTRDYAVAAEFIKKDGISLLLKYFKTNPQPDECTLLVVNIFRHAMEDPATVEGIMRHDFKRWNQMPRGRPADIPTFMRYMQPSALRDPVVFLNLTKELCELTDPHPSNGSHRIKFKEKTPANVGNVEISESAADGNAPKKGDGSMQHKAEPNELVVTMIHYLVSEMMSQAKPPSEIKESTEGISSTTATTEALATTTNSTDTSTGVQEQTAPTLPLPGAPKDLDYPRLITDILTELLLSYDSCKLAFLSYTRKKIANTTNKEKDATTKIKSPALQYLLQEITSVKGDPSEWPKRQAKINHLHTMIVALCADINVTADLKAVSPVVTAVRKAVLDAIAKAIKENNPPNTAEGAEARYGRYHALAQVCERLLTVNLHLATTKAHEDSLIHISKLMLEKNFVSILSGILSEIDLNHPLASNLTAAVLAPLENLTKVATKIGRLGEKEEEGPSELADFISESLGDDDEDMLTESEGTPDPYSTSALGMYGGETDNAYVEVEDDAVHDEDEDIDMEYPENDFATDDSGTDEEDQVMNLAQGGDIDGDDSDEEEEEDFDGDEEEMHGGDEDVDDGEDDEGESGEEEDGADEADMLWQHISEQMDGSGDLLGIGDVGDEDEDEIEEALDAGLMDQMGAHVDDMGFLDIADEMADAPVFENPPAMGILPPPPDLADPARIFNLEMIFGQHREALPPGGQDPLHPPWDLAPTFDHFLDFAPIRSNNRRLRANVRLQDMLGGLGGPAVQMLQDMARMHPGDIQFAFSGNAAHLFFNSDPTLDPQMRPRVTQYLDVRPPRRGREMRDGSSAMLSTQGRWADEARINAGPTYQERLDNLGNHVTVVLLPAAREAAKIASENAQREAKEAEEKAKAEREEADLKAKEELEAQQKRETEEAAERQREEEEAAIAATAAAAAAAEAEAAAQAASQLEDTTMNAGASTSGVPEPIAIIPDEPVASTSNTQTPPSTVPARIVVIYQGQEVDITDADIDPEFLQAVPDDIRDEIIGNYVREQQRQARPSRPAEAEMDMDFLNALPADIREDVLRGQAAQITGVPAEMDAASVLATLPEELRQTVLLEQDDGTLQALPSSVIAEVNALRAQQQSRRIPASMLQPDRELNPPISRKLPPHREAVQLLDKSGIANLVRLLFYTDTNRRTALQQVLVNLSENSKSRNDLLTLLIVMLQGGKNDIGGVDKIFSQLSVRSSAKAHSSGKGKHKEIDSHPVTVSTTSTLPDEVVVQRSLDTLTAIVNANELASLYFLIEQELPHSLQRSPSKKGKGKERQDSPAHYPFVQLLTLLERHHLLQQSHMLDAISSLLCTVTKPLAILREVKDDTPEDKSKEESPAEQSQTTEVPAQPPGAPPVEQPQQSPEAVIQPAETSINAPSVDPTIPAASTSEPSKKSPSPPSREQVLRSKPPQFPETALRLVVNLLTVGECSSRCFQNTQALIFHLAALTGVRDVIIAELKVKAEELGTRILQELDALSKAVKVANEGDELPGTITAKFSLPSSNQAKLLRILKTMENIYSTSVPGRSAQAAEPANTDEKVQVIYESLPFGSLWRRLSDCLTTVEERPDATHVATFLLPLMEAVMVTCKPFATQTQQAAAAAARARASASPRSPEVSQYTNRRETIGETFLTFTDQHRKVLNLMVRNKPSLMNGSFSLLVNNPRVLDFDNKRSYFTHKLRYRSRSERERESYPTVAINVRRARVFEESFQAVTRVKAKDFKYGKLNVRFVGEEGVDAGGVTREWFRILAREIFNPNYALFAPCGADRLTYQPNPLSGINPDHLRYFKFVGRIIGKAIFDQRLLDGHFARSMYRQLLGKPVDYTDLEWSDPSYYNSLRWMLDHSVEQMELTFSEHQENLGEAVIVDLKENGRNILVTDENKDEYIQLIAEYRLTTSIKPQLDAFLEGFYEIVPKEHISIFNEKEVELLISGTPEIDVDDWRSATEYHGYSASDAVIVWWWRALKSFSKADRAKVLSFATGTAKVPLGGFAELPGMDGVQRFSIHKDPGPMNRLPQAHTCFNQIDLPEYSSYEMLRQQLMLAVNEGGEGFGFA